MRVSTKEQSFELQEGSLQEAGCERICEDVVSGTKDARPGLERLLDALRVGDVVIIWKLDRLAHSPKMGVRF